MKLAVVSPYPPEVSGVAHYGARLAAGFARTGRFAQMQVFANALPGAPPAEDRDGLAVRRVWRRDHLGAAWATLRALLQWQPDLAFFNLGLTTFGSTRPANFIGLAAPMLARRLGLPTVVTLHEVFETADLRALGAVNGRLTHWGGQAATAMLLQANTVCLTLQTYQLLIRMKYGARNVAHVPLGAFEPPRFSPLPAEKRIMILAKYAPHKGLPELIAMFRRLRQADPAVTLTVAGSDHARFPGYTAGVQAATGELAGLDWRVDVPDEELPALFASARVVALPATAAAGASSVVQRAAGGGRPMVAYDLPELRAVAAEERLRIDFVPQGFPELFAERLAHWLNHTDEGEMVGRANVAAMQSITVDQICWRYISIFEQAASRWGVGSSQLEVGGSNLEF